MLYHGSKAGAFDLKTIVMECLTSMRRAGKSMCKWTQQLPNIVAPTMLKVVVYVLAVVCKRMQQLPSMLGTAVHRGKDTTHKTLQTMCNACAGPQQCWKSCANRSKRNVGSCWLKSLISFKLCATTCNRVCKQTQHGTSNNIGSCWLTMFCPFAHSQSLK